MKISMIDGCIFGFVVIAMLVSGFGFVPVSAAGDVWLDGTPIIKKMVTERIAAAGGEDVLPSEQERFVNTGNALPDHAAFWVFNFESYFEGGETTEEQVQCTLQSVGEHCCIYVSDDEWSNGHVTADQVTDWMSLFDDSTPSPVSPDKGIYEIDGDNFGYFPTEKDIDGDSLVYLVIVDIKDGYSGGGDSYIGGYFSDVHEHTGTYAGWHCNGHEMVTLDCYPSFKPGNIDFARGTLAHEYQHLLHWGHDENEATWVDEGCADFAMWLCGYPPEGGDYSHVGYFVKNHDTSLTYWDLMDPLPNYGASYLWTMYCYEHFGGKNFLNTLVAEAQNGIRGINRTFENLGLDMDFDRAFDSWTVANYLDLSDTLKFDGEYSYKGLNLDDYNYGQGIRPDEIVVSHPSSGSSGLPDWAAEYIKFSGIPDQAYAFGIDGDPSDSLAGSVILFNNGSVYSVRELYPEESGGARISLFEFGLNYDKVVMVPHPAVDHLSQQEGYTASFTWFSSADVDSFIPPPPPPDGEPFEPDSLDLAVYQNPFFTDHLTIHFITVFRPDAEGVTISATFEECQPEILDTALLDSFSVYGDIEAFRYSAGYVLPGAGDFTLLAAFTDTSGVERSMEREYSAVMASAGEAVSLTSTDCECTVSVPAGAVSGSSVWFLLKGQVFRGSSDERAGASVFFYGEADDLPVGKFKVDGNSKCYVLGPAGFVSGEPLTLEVLTGAPPAQDLEPVILYSTDDGESWTPLLSDADIDYRQGTVRVRADLPGTGTFLPAWQRSSGNIPTSQQGIFLGQCSPNPFNPSTLIPVEIPRREDTGTSVCNVRLAVFDITGKLMDVIYDGELTDGRHAFNWNPRAGTSSGVYIARLEVENYEPVVMRMVLLK